MTQVVQTCGPAPPFKRGCQGQGAQGLPGQTAALPWKRIFKISYKKCLPSPRPLPQWEVRLHDCPAPGSLRTLERPLLSSPPS